MLFKFRKTGQGCNYFIDKKRLKKSINIKKNYINFFLNITFQRDYSPSYFMIMVLLRGLLKGSVCRTGR